MDLNSTWDLALTCLGFQILAILTLTLPELRANLRARTAKQWFLDLQGLLVQGLVVPLAKIFGLIAALRLLWPAGEKSLNLPAWASFLIAFAVVDYLYYWNHRLMHGPGFWPLHAVHHSTQTLDLFATSRNSLWTPFFICYIWVHTFFAYALQHPAPYVLGAVLTAILDLWRHSPGLDYLMPKFLRPLFISPADHASHHSLRGLRSNFGANLTLWDRLHGTYEAPPSHRGIYGWNDKRGTLRLWLLPWNLR